MPVKIRPHFKADPNTHRCSPVLTAAFAAIAAGCPPPWSVSSSFGTTTYLCLGPQVFFSGGNTVACRLCYVGCQVADTAGDSYSPPYSQFHKTDLTAFAHAARMSADSAAR